MEASSLKVELTPLHRIAAVTLIVAQYILFFVGVGLFFHYATTPIPGVTYPSMITSTSSETHYVHNICLYLLFWAQHIVMATLKFKVTFSAKSPYFSLYDRYIYNILSGIILWYIVGSFKPSFIYLFTISSWVCIPISLVGLYLYFDSMRLVGEKIMMPFKLSSLLNEKYLEITPYQATRQNKLIREGVYRWIRHPMQAGLILLILFGSGVYTIERLLFAAVMVPMIVFGVLMEEKRLCCMEKKYPQYMEQVKGRFIPNLI